MALKASPWHQWIREHSGFEAHLSHLIGNEQVNLLALCINFLVSLLLGLDDLKPQKRLEL